MEETRFFTNKPKSGDHKIITLFEKMERIFNNMPAKEFMAVAGYFRSSGYFKLREIIDDSKTQKLRILVGINVDSLTANYRDIINSATAKEHYTNFVVEDISHDSGYGEEVERGVRQMIKDLQEGRLEMKLYKDQNLHAKFYVFLPDGYCEERLGHVIMGSSNLSDSGLGKTNPPRYEMNVDLVSYPEVEYCRKEFEALWAEGIPLTADAVGDAVKKTYIGQAPTPYEIFIRVLIDKLGGQVEDGFSFTMPEGVMKLGYQTDAAIQGYQTILRHNGVVLADVVGLGKTIIATMIVKRFMEANGKDTKTLVVTPPAVRDNWKDTFDLFGLKKNKHYQIVTNGSLHKIINNEDYDYLPMEDFDLVIVDEAHSFRTGTTDGYGNLQRICKSAPARRGNLNRDRKGVLLLSATPLNNRPEDIKNLLLLFQDSQASTIEGVPNLDNYFSEKIRAYKEIIKAAKDPSGADLTLLAKKADELNEGIRADVLSKVTIRRTRTNILNNPDYAADLQAQGIVFPVIDAPREVAYDKNMDDDTRDLFFSTFRTFAEYDPDKEAGDFDSSIINYGAHRALEFLDAHIFEEIFGGRQTNGKHIAQTLAGIYRTHMVKRLESSFAAFKKSLDTFMDSTSSLIAMLESGTVTLNIKDVDADNESQLDNAEAADGSTDDEETTPARGTRQFKASDFDPLFKAILKSDLAILRRLKKDWDKEKDNPKWDCFKETLDDMLSPDVNPTGKLVVFSEYVDTLESLKALFHNDLGRDDVLMVTSKNRKFLHSKIKANFDANLCAEQQRDDVKILLTSDAMSEGVNLHRANVIVNYDSPWNATRLMQRIGRINRIGSASGHIVNYMFYPTKMSERKIALSARSVVKLQSFHSALGEDSQIYSHEEIVHQFELFNKDVRDNVDKELELLRVLRQLYATDRDLYEKIKNLPAKSRTWRSRQNRPDGAQLTPQQTLVYIARGEKKEFYQVLPGQEPRHLDFAEAVDILRAEPTEPTAQHSDADAHFAAVTAALADYHAAERAEQNAAIAQQKVNATGSRNSRILNSAKSFLRAVARLSDGQADTVALTDRLTELLDAGTFSQLDNEIDRLRKKLGKNEEAIAANLAAITHSLTEMSQRVGPAQHAAPAQPQQQPAAAQAKLPQVIISESFVD